MCVGRIHRDDGIKQDLEVGTCGRAAVVGGKSRGKMSSGRSSHYTYLGRVNIPFFRIVAHDADGLLRIGKRNFVMSLRQAVFEHCIRDALIVEPLRHVVSLMSHGKPSVSASGAHYHSLSVWFLRKVHGDGRVAGIIVGTDSFCLYC